MPDYDPKNIPLLDDIIEQENEASASHEKINLSDEISADDSTLNLFNDTTADIEIDSTEPEIGSIDEFIENETKIDIIESTLIDYSFENNTKGNTTTDAQTVDKIYPSGGLTDQHEEITRQPAIIDPTITLDSMVDDIITQLMPDLELQLHSLIQKALREKLPEEIIRQMSAENDD